MMVTLLGLATILLANDPPPPPNRWPATHWKFA